MKTIVRRGLATLLAICMMITLIPMTAFADEENECNHEYEWVNTATCTNAGNRSYRCKFCQEPNTENGVWQEYVGPLGHDYTKEDTTAEGACIKAPTCVEEGKYYYSCSRCGAVEKNENRTFTVDATGEHSLENGVCTVCGYNSSNEGGNTEPLPEKVVKVEVKHEWVSNIEGKIANAPVEVSLYAVLQDENGNITGEATCVEKKAVKPDYEGKASVVFAEQPYYGENGNSLLYWTEVKAVDGYTNESSTAGAYVGTRADSQNTFLNLEDKGTDPSTGKHIYETVASYTNTYIGGKSDVQRVISWSDDNTKFFDNTSHRPSYLEVEVWRMWMPRNVNGVSQTGGDEFYKKITLNPSNEWTFLENDVVKYAENGASYSYYLKHTTLANENESISISHYSISKSGNSIKLTLKTVSSAYTLDWYNSDNTKMDGKSFQIMQKLGAFPNKIIILLQRTIDESNWETIPTKTDMGISYNEGRVCGRADNIYGLSIANYDKIRGTWGPLPKYKAGTTDEYHYRAVEGFVWINGKEEIVKWFYSNDDAYNDVLQNSSKIYKPSTVDIQTSVRGSTTTCQIKNMIDTTPIKLTTIWDDENNKYNSRPDSVNLKLTFGSKSANISVKKPADAGANNSDGTTSDGNSNSTGIIYMPTLENKEYPDALNSGEYKVEVTEDSIASKIFMGFGKQYQYTTTIGEFTNENGVYNAVVTNKGKISDYECPTHEGGQATCSSKAICTICGMEYGDKASHEMQLTEHDGVIVNGCKNCDYIISKINNGISTKLSATFAAKALSGADFSAKFLLQKKNSEGNWVDANSGDVFSVAAQSGVTVNTEDGVTVTLTDFGGADIKADYDGIVLRKNIIVEQELKPVAYRWLLNSVTVNGEAVSFDKSKWTENSSEHTLKYNNGCKLDNLGPDGADVFFKTTATYNDYKILLTGERQIEIKAYIQDTDGTNIAANEDKMESVWAGYQIYRNDIVYVDNIILNKDGFDETAECWKCEMTVPRYDDDGVEYNYSVNQVKIIDPHGVQYSTAMGYSSDIRENGDDIKLPCMIASFTNKVKGGGYDNNKLTFNIKKVWKDGGETNSRKDSLVKIYRLRDDNWNVLEEPVLIRDVWLSKANNWQQTVLIEKAFDEDTSDAYIVVEGGVKFNGNQIDLKAKDNLDLEYVSNDVQTLNVKIGTIGNINQKDETWDGLDYIYDSYLRRTHATQESADYTITNVRTSKVNIDATVELDDSTISKVRYGLYCGDNQVASFDTSKSDVIQNWSSGMNHDDISVKVNSVDNVVTLSIKGLDRFDGNGDSLYYSLKEIGIYSSSSNSFETINNNQCYVDDKKYDVSSKRTVTYAKAKTHHSPDVYAYAFTNAALEGSVDIDIEWVDGNNRADTRKYVVIKLYRDGELYATWTPSNDEESDSSHTFSNLPKYRAGTSELSEYQLKVEKTSIYKMAGQIAGQDIETEFTLENDDSLTGTVKLTYIGLRGLQTLTFAGVTDNTVTKICGDGKYTEAVSGARTNVTYSSSNAEVATVNASTGEVTIKGAGNAIITATAALTTEYEAATVSYTLFVKSTQNITFTNVIEGSVVKTYGDNKFTETVDGAQTTVTYSSNNAEVATVKASTGEVTIKGAGSVTITATTVETSEYTEATASYTLTVNKAKVDLPTAKTGLTYNKTEQTGVELPSGAVYTLSDNKGTNATSYTAIATLNDTANYEWKLENPTTDYQEINWSIAKKEIHVTAVDKSSTVGSDLVALTYTCNDICEGDPFTGALKTDADKDTVDTDDITQGTLSAGDNYNIIYTKGTYTVTKIKVDLPTAKTGLTYNKTEQTGVEAQSGAVYTLSGNKGTNATSYTAIATLNDTANYEWNLETPTTDYQRINWSIAKKKINVKAADKSSTVGSDLVALTYTCNDICEGDQFEGALATNANKNAANTYDITQGNLSAGNNYEIIFTPGKYTVKAKQTPKQDNESSEKGSGSENANTGTNASSTDTKASVGASTDTNADNNAATVKAQTRQSTTKKSSVTVKVDTEEALEDETLNANDDSDKLEGDGSVEEESQNNSREESENQIASGNESTVVGQDGNLAIVDEGNADSIDNNSNEADDNNVFTWLMLVCAAFVLAGGGTGILFVKKNKR